MEAAAGARHERKVARIAEQLRRRKSTAPLSRLKKSVSRQVPQVHDRKHTDEKIDLLDLDEVIEIDAERRICIAEPGVPFCKLVDQTLPLGLVPIVVPELKTITIGGAVAGCSIESMSYVYGGFHDTCIEYEIITAKGDVLVCTPDNEHSLIFQMMHGSFGTVGILSRLVFRLIPAKPFVHLRHETHTSIESYLASIWSHFESRDVDFMDGIIHSPSHLVLCVGDFVDRAPYTNRYDWLKVYYQSTAERREDYLETPHYCRPESAPKPGVLASAAAIALHYLRRLPRLPEPSKTRAGIPQSLAGEVAFRILRQQCTIDPASLIVTQGRA